MRRILALTVLSVLPLGLLAACAVPAGPVVSEERSIDDVSAVVLESAGDLVVTRGEPSLTITAGSALMDALTSEIRDGVLYLGVRPGAGLLRFGEVRYELTLPTLESIDIEGSGDVEADFAGASEVSIVIGGSGDVEATGLDADSVVASIDGSGDIDLAGRTARLEASIGGSGTIDAEELQSADAVASIDGSGDIRVSATSTLDASVSGSGDIIHSGGAVVTSSVDGSGTIAAERD